MRPSLDASRLSPPRRSARAACAPLVLLGAASCTAHPPAGDTAGTDGVVVTVEPDGSGVAEPLLAAIEGARSAVHVEMYLLTSDAYLQALESLHARGIEVRVVLNRVFPPGTSAATTNAASYERLLTDGIDVRWAPTTTGFDGYTHAKTVVIDPGSPAGAAWILTMNLDASAPRDNREYLARDTRPADVAEAEAIFEADFEDESITPTGALVVAPSPQDSAAAALLGLVESATTTLDLEAEELTRAGVEAPIFDALVEKAAAGVRVRVVLEESTAASQRAAVAALESAGAEIVGSTRGAGGLYIHAKAIVADGARAFVGSENLSGGSLGYNREIGVLFSDPTEVAKVDGTILADFEAGAPYGGG